MRQYNWATGQMEEVEAYCDVCGEPIQGTSGYKVQYVENEGKKQKILMGSCCAGKIHCTGVLSKQQREAYKSKGQISEDVLARHLPKAPPPNSADNRQAGKKAHEFIDKIGRSALTKTRKGRVNLKKGKRGMSGAE